MAPMKLYTTSVGSSANNYEFAILYLMIRVLQNIGICDLLKKSSPYIKVLMKKLDEGRNSFEVFEAATFE